jgi:transcription antitermination factor NusG
MATALLSRMAETAVDTAGLSPAISGAERWYAVYTRSNCEFKVSRHLSTRGLVEFLPVYKSRRQWSDRSRELDLPLFAGYVFCRFDPHRAVPVVSTPGVVRVIGSGRTAVPIADAEIDAIRAICTSGVRAQPWPFLEVGRRVAIVNGPLTGIEGIVVELKNQFRLVVSVSLLQRSVAAEIEREWIQPLSFAASANGVQQ